MALSTSNRVAYDCKTCGKPIYADMVRNEWRHIDRKSECTWVLVTTVELFNKPATELDVAA